MMGHANDNTNPARTFAAFPFCHDPRTCQAGIAIIGAPLVTTYAEVGDVGSGGAEDLVTEGAPHPGRAPAAVRAMSWNYREYLSNYDFEFEGELLAGGVVRIVDCGDIPMRDGEEDANRAAAEAAIRALVQSGAAPIVLGGDHATTIPALRAFEGSSPLCAVQIDAHLDWRDEVAGKRQGYSSPMRRAAELPWVTRMAQIGLRGIGSATPATVKEARAWGSVLVPAAEVHALGVAEVLRRLPEAERYYVTLDMDGLDPSEAPAVIAPAPGGLSYYQTAALLRGIAERGRLVGCDLVELAPQLDVGKRTILLAVRLVLNLIGILSRQGA
jgi:agmatinase